MKLLFDFQEKDANEEIKSLLGHIHKGLKFSNLKSDIISSTREIIKIIGSSVYDEVVGKYEVAEPPAEHLELINAIRYPIVLNAYRQIADSLDLAHTNNGRKMITDEKWKNPFQWMLDRDNEVMERKYYKALDEMIEYLDDHLATWKQSDAYAKSHRYFVRKVSDFDEYFPIESRYLLIKLQPGLRQCENRSIKAILTPEKFDALKTKLKAGTALDPSEKVTLEYIKEACVYHSLYWGVRVLRVTLFPEGVLQTYISDRNNTKATKVPEKLEAELAAQVFKNQADEALRQLKNNVATTLVEPSEEDTESLSTPDFGFDDDDSFVSM